MKTENELIAEFLGIRWHENGTVSHYPSVLPMRMGEDYVGDLKFQTSWDWLMPVVEKIEALNKRSIIIEGLTATTSLNVELIPTSLGGCIAKRGESKIQSVYQLCVEFIRWYNSQNS